MSAILVALVVAAASGAASIPPLVESDYCYQLIAVDRLLEGKGLTSLQPVAPHQPWQWKYDYGFLTQWPAGYALLVAGIRVLLGCSSLEACRLISLMACGAALTGWFAVVRRSIPPGITGVVLAAVAAASGLTAGFVVNPSTDLILIATLPFLWLLVIEGLNGGSSRGMVKLALAGILGGGLFWFRYAGIFVPVGVVAFLFVLWIRGKLAPGRLLVFWCAAAIPILALVAVNAVFSPASSPSSRFNLGGRVGFDFAFANLARAWWIFTDFGFYDYRQWVHWLFALWPLAMPVALLYPPVRASMAKVFASLPFQLGACLLVALLAMLVGATTLFGAKFDYIGLERYYLPCRPPYFLLFLSPLMLVPRRVIRAGMCVTLLMLASWTWFEDWSAAWERWAQAQRPATISGAWSRIFEPHAAQVHDWVRTAGQDRSLLIFSNFHEYLTLETGIPVLPIPDSKETLAYMRQAAKTIRKVDDPQPVFVLHPDNLWRSYWLPNVALITEEFKLEPSSEIPVELGGHVMRPKLE